MTDYPPVIRTVAALRERIKIHREKGMKIGLVPTMGALHHGHLSLVDVISQHADIIIVSIFVNPTQFGEGEDFETYPRHEKDDLEKLSHTKTTMVFAPSVTEMYPEGDASILSVRGITERFEGVARPHHFSGVATVVSKLLLQAMPDIAIFGEKDFQQLAVIKRFVKDMHIPVQIIGGPIIREKDGLAASSRNVYLSAEGRKIAAKLNVILRQLITDVSKGRNINEAERCAIQKLQKAGFTSIDYVNVVDPNTLLPVTRLSANNGARVLAVARIDNVRLLDNMAIEAP